MKLGWSQDQSWRELNDPNVQVYPTTCPYGCRTGPIQAEHPHWTYPTYPVRSFRGFVQNVMGPRGGYLEYWSNG